MNRAALREYVAEDKEFEKQSSYLVPKNRVRKIVSGMARHFGTPLPEVVFSIPKKTKWYCSKCFVPESRCKNPTKHFGAMYSYAAFTSWKGRDYRIRLMEENPSLATLAHEFAHVLQLEKAEHIERWAHGEQFQHFNRLVQAYALKYAKE
jgi:hypothetical protein